MFKTFNYSFGMLYVNLYFYVELYKQNGYIHTLFVLFTIFFAIHYVPEIKNKMLFVTFKKINPGTVFTLLFIYLLFSFPFYFNFAFYNLGVAYLEKVFIVLSPKA